MYQGKVNKRKMKNIFKADLNQVSEIIATPSDTRVLCSSPFPKINKEIKSIGPFLAPFLKTSCLYFIIEPEPGTLRHSIIKLLPILVLLAFISAQGLRGNKYNQWIMAGLTFCAIGDMVLVWQNLTDLFFIIGMASFGIGHIMYIIGFGMTPFGLKEFLFACSLLILAIAGLTPCLSPPFTFIVPIYCVLLTILWWRAAARFKLKESEIPWRKIYAALGATLFIISDLVLAINKFCCPVPYENALIMSTYYGAQMFIAFSIINSQLFGLPTDQTWPTQQNTSNAIDVKLNGTSNKLKTD